MPVTAKLSKLFYDRLGDEIATELVDWFNAVDATYRADLREINELNFARFDAKLEQRVVELHAKIDRKIARLEIKIEREVARLEATIQREVARLEGKIDALGTRLQAGIGQLEARIDDRATTLSATLSEAFERRLGQQSRWLIMGWVALVGAVVAQWFRG